MDALIYGSSCKYGERTIAAHTIWFNCKGPLETNHTKPKRAGKTFFIFKTYVWNWSTEATWYGLNLSHRSSHFPSFIILLVTAHSHTKKNVVLHIIEMGYGLELNSITYSNPRTNKSNIAQGQKAFNVFKSKTKEQAIKDLPHFTAYSISKLFPLKLYDGLSVAWKHLSVTEPPALTSRVKVSQALPVCGFSQDPLPVGMSAPLLSPHQLRMLLLPSKSFLKPEEKKKKSDRFPCRGQLV